MIIMLDILDEFRERESLSSGYNLLIFSLLLFIQFIHLKWGCSSVEVRALVPFLLVCPYDLENECLKFKLF